MHHPLISVLSTLRYYTGDCCWSIQFYLYPLPFVILFSGPRPRYRFVATELSPPRSERWYLSQTLEALKALSGILPSSIPSFTPSPRMPRHSRVLFMRAGAKIQNWLEKSARDNKEYGQKAATSAYVFLFYGHINSPGQVPAYGICRGRINK